MVIFNSYVKLPEGIDEYKKKHCKAKLEVITARCIGLTTGALTLFSKFLNISADATATSQ